MNAEELAPAVRKGSISQDDLIQAAMSLIGPTRSMATLSLREVARTAGIAPNSFYRHFRDVDELGIALIALAGSSLRHVFSEARQRISAGSSVVQTSLNVFYEQLNAKERYLELLLCEGRVGSLAYQAEVDRQLQFFEHELTSDLIRLEAQNANKLHEPTIVAKAITRLVFSMGAQAVAKSPEQQQELLEQTATMVYMILAGARALAAPTEPTV
ncbi:HTH-type transcriptional repressor FabR [Paraperlucidibaca wandonensis]|uniref:HTH-type transcriptional repressor FabR n=1 Tax=Paraperlucidibaca wandonensis TaxID=1268273 RepID=A0ABW3HHE7_9GAMM|nr:HTH-type transcriptional repressor FabR [Paraperlucidibaca sp.]MBQ0723049.1 HTH-type transcriptional repressor FabR [Paraperlucidibaca sp.]MBQ0842707.1 HTH-type transcriptional repressor FabR [Paraperlucidibaca sp.]